MKTRIKRTLSILAAMTLASCAQDTGGGQNQPGGVWPPDGNVIQSSRPIQFNISRDSVKSSGKRHTFSIFADSNGAKTIASGSMADSGSAGGVSWSPGSDFIIEPNTQYWWQWQDGAGNKSRIYTFFASAWQGGKPISPRNGGFMDRNMRAAPTLGVSNVYTGPGLNPTYDFQIFDKPSATAPIAEKMGEPQAVGDNHTRYKLPVTLSDGGTYYWRVRVNAPGVDNSWSRLSSFTVTDVCQIDGPGYAAWAIDWVPKKCANVITHQDMNDALGLPNASAEYTGFISMDYGGELFLELGMTITDAPGPEIHVFEFVSTEFLEVFVGPTEAGPWTPLGAAFCHRVCEFDLAQGGVTYARYIRIRDLDAQGYICHDTSGCDIDAVLWGSGYRSPMMCGSRWW